jgi:hypothetical protein
MFRVAVVFLTPEALPPPQVRTPTEISISVSSDLNAPDPLPEPGPKLFELARQVAFSTPPGSIDATQVSALAGPAAITAGDSVLVQGSGMDQAEAANIYLSAVGGAPEWPITGWRVYGASASGTAGDADHLVLRFPQTYGATPAAGVALAATPPPGNYLLTVGSDAPHFRSNALPLSIGPLETGIGPTAPILTPNASGAYTLNASGLVDGSTQVWLNQIELTIAAAVAPGAAVVNAAAGTVEFQLPAAGFTAGGFAQVRVITNGIEAPPGWWLQIPWPLLTPNPSGVYTLNVNGLVAGETSVLLNQTALTIAAALAPGTATVDAIIGAIHFELPTTGFTSGSYVQVSIAVNGVLLQAAWWVQIP